MMGLGDKLRDLLGVGAGSLHPDGLAELHVGDASYDDWDVVRDFEDLETARAWRQQLTDAGLEADHRGSPAQRVWARRHRPACRRAAGARPTSGSTSLSRPGPLSSPSA